MIARLRCRTEHTSWREDDSVRQQSHDSDVVAVVTAIGAASLAGVIALYRERWIELAELLVAARVLSAAVETVNGLLGTMSKQAAEIPSASG